METQAQMSVCVCVCEEDEEEDEEEEGHNTTVAHLNKQWQKWLRMSTHTQTHTSYQ